MTTDRPNTYAELHRARAAVRAAVVKPSTTDKKEN